MPEWDGLLPPVSCGERPIIDGVRTPVAYSSLIVEVEIWDLCLPVRHTCMYNATGRLHTNNDPQLEVLKHLGHANFDDNRPAGLKRFFHLSVFGMMFG